MNSENVSTDSKSKRPPLSDVSQDLEFSIVKHSEIFNLGRFVYSNDGAFIFSIADGKLSLSSSEFELQWSKKLPADFEAYEMYISSDDSIVALVGANSSLLLDLQTRVTTVLEDVAIAPNTSYCGVPNSIFTRDQFFKKGEQILAFFYSGVRRDPFLVLSAFGDRAPGRLLLDVNGLESEHKGRFVLLTPNIRENRFIYSVGKKCLSYDLGTHESHLLCELPEGIKKCEEIEPNRFFCNTARTLLELKIEYPIVKFSELSQKENLDSFVWVSNDKAIGVCNGAIGFPSHIATIDFGNNSTGKKLVGKSSDDATQFVYANPNRDTFFFIDSIGKITVVRRLLSEVEK